MIPTLAAGILLLLAPPASRGAGPTSAPPAGVVVPVPTPAPAVAPTFEELWSVYVKADATGDAAAATPATLTSSRGHLRVDGSTRARAWCLTLLMTLGAVVDRLLR